MELDWGDADPNYFLGRLMGWCVSINGTDRLVTMVSTSGVDVLDWDDAAGRGVEGTSHHFKWDEVASLFVY